MYRYRYSIVCILDTTVDAVDFPRSSELEVNERTGTSDWLAARLQPITKHLTVFFGFFYRTGHFSRITAAAIVPSKRTSRRGGASASNGQRNRPLYSCNRYALISEPV